MKNSNFTFSLNPFTTHAFKVLCAQQRKSMSKLVDSWISDYLTANGVNLKGVIDNVD